MSNNQYLDQYKELYSKYVAARVGMHNYHIRFLEYLGIESYYRLREHMHALPSLEKDMLKLAKLAVKEQTAIAKAEKTEKKLARHKKKLNKNVDLSGGTS